MITKSPAPTSLDELKGSMTRDAFLRGEPMRRDKLVKAGVGGFMSAMLPTGMRAVAIKIDNCGDFSAGGFILPNDRVDVVRVYRDDEATKARGVEVIGAQTILSNVHVLAIGQNVQEENGKKVVVGGNATLELDPKQAEHRHLRPAGRRAICISCCAASSTAAARPQTVDDRQDSNATGLTIVRYGAAQASGPLREAAMTIDMTGPRTNGHAPLGAPDRAVGRRSRRRWPPSRRDALAGDGAAPQFAFVDRVAAEREACNSASAGR